MHFEKALSKALRCYGSIGLMAKDSLLPECAICRARQQRTDSLGRQLQFKRAFMPV